MSALTLFASAPTVFRSDRTKAQAQGVDRKGGDGFGVIYGASAIAEGEALGHDSYIDKTMLSQVVDAINDKGNLGIKIRFAHPSMSGDGIGTSLGKGRNARLSEAGDSVVFDLNFSNASTKTPDGNLADYVMTLAEESPEDFGMSISFQRDIEAEDEYRLANLNEDGQFVTPDERNVDNLKHVRLRKLMAIDAVDTPAANPKGLFYSSKNGVLDIANEALSYITGISDHAPDSSSFGVHPDRAKAFFSRFLATNNLKLVDAKSNSKIEGTKPDDNITKNNSMSKESLEALSKEVTDLSGVVNELSQVVAGINSAPQETKAPDCFSEEDALKVLGLTAEELSASKAAKAAADKAAEEAEFNARVQKQFEIMGLTATPAPPAASIEPAIEPVEEPVAKSWAEKVESDKGLAADLSFSKGWKTGEVDLSSLPDNQEAFILLARATEKYGEESEFASE
jgi:hypothetical protein